MGFRRLRSTLLAAGFLLGGSRCVAAAPTEIQPFLNQHCVSCHGPQKQKGDLRLDSFDGLAPDAERARLENVLEQLALNEMPPEDEKQPSASEREAAVAWLEGKLGQAGDGGSLILKRLELPGFGNYVNHEALFTEPAIRKAASPARLWRISPYIFRESVNLFAGERLLVVKRNQGGDGLHPALPFLTPAHSFRDLAAPHFFEEATTELLLDMAWRIAERQIDSKQRAKQEWFGFAAKEADASEDDYRRAIRYQFGLVLQREPSVEELRGLLDLAVRTQREAGPRQALQSVLSAILITPPAVFRSEVGDSSTDAFGRAKLTARELSFALSFALTDELPDAKLQEAAAADKLSGPSEIRSEVRRLLADAKTDKPRILRFFQEFFEYTRAPQIFKDGLERKYYLPEQMVEDADTLVMHILRDDRDVLTRLLTEDRVTIFEGGLPPREQNVGRARGGYFPILGFPRDWEWTNQQPIKPVIGRRVGILSHPAWLMAFSDNEKNQAIQRGLWVRTKLLGGTVSEAPIGVNAQFPVDETLTLREKMNVTREAYCWRCHQKMDDLGLPFEQWDDFGRYRTEEHLGGPRPTQPGQKSTPKVVKSLDISGRIAGSGESQLDGPVKDPFEYMAKLAGSHRVRQVFVRHAFRYWLGRNETLDDAPTLIDADRAYVESGGSMNALITSLLSSDSFLYRRRPAASSPSEKP